MRSPADRAAAAFVAALLAVGCLILWVGVPAGGMWLAGQLTDSFGLHMPLALALVVPAMLLAAIGLAWLNDLYLRITGGQVVRSGSFSYRRHGPLEPLLLLTLALALVAFLLWFFLLAENPAPGVF